MVILYVTNRIVECLRVHGYFLCGCVGRHQVQQVEAAVHRKTVAGNQQVFVQALRNAQFHTTLYIYIYIKNNILEKYSEFLWQKLLFEKKDSQALGNAQFDATLKHIRKIFLILMAEITF